MFESAIQEFLDANGVELEDGTKDDPPLAKFEVEIGKYKEIQSKIQALPTSANIGWIKVRVPLFSHPLQLFIHMPGGLHW